MPAKLLSEYVAKKLYYRWQRKNYHIYTIDRSNIDLVQINVDYPNPDAKFVIKVDQQIKSRLKKGLIKLNVTLGEILSWIESLDKSYVNFIIEPIVESVENEFYLLIRNVGMQREFVLLSNGGVNISDINTTNNKLVLEYGQDMDREKLMYLDINPAIIPTVIDFYQFYLKYHLTFLEINPLAQSNGAYIPLDMLAKYDNCSLYLWDMIDAQLIDTMIDTNKLAVEEKNIIELSKKTGSSLKFKLLNQTSRVWFVLFGGGASVCFFDKWMKIAKMYPNANLMPANYGEMSGNPSQDFVQQYMDNFFNLMAKSTSVLPHYLIIGGAIANFTLVDKTFAGINDAIDLHHDMLITKCVKIYVRRGGPNYQIGLDNLTKCCAKYDIPCYAYGPDEPMTSILDMINQIENNHQGEISVYDCVDNSLLVPYTFKTMYHFTDNTTCLIFGSQIDVAQNMMDFDYYTGRSKPSVVGFIDPARRNITNVQVFWGQKSILLSIYPTIEMAIMAHPMVNGMVNFASHRTAYESTISAMTHSNIKFISILAEGMAENSARDLITMANARAITLLGPSTIGAVFPGKFRIGNAGGKLDNLVCNNLHRMGCVGIVTKSGGLLNELCHIVFKVGLGVAAAIALGGDQYSGTTFADVIYYYEHLSSVKIIVLLGEIGGLGELEVASMVNDRLITKPIIALCLGSAADLLSSDIQFGHAGASAQSKYESAFYKNSSMANSGIYVPSNWEHIEKLLSALKNKYQLDDINPDDVMPVLSFHDALQSNLVRKQCNFFSSISNEKGFEITYNNKPLSAFNCIGDVIGNLWFKRDLPEYLTHYYEKIIIICADHGPCVSGAQNTMIASRAGKDLVSSLCSGLLTIGPKFGGAISDAAIQFYYGAKNKEDPVDFVKRIKLIPGIGHKHYSIYKPDKRVIELSSYVDSHFIYKSTINFARSIESITTKKKPNLILNADGFIAASIIDGFFSAGFTENEVEEILSYDMLNSFFILARTIGLIGHHIDQKRLKQDLYRASEYDVGYL